MTTFRIKPKPLTVRKRGANGRNKSEREHWAFQYGTNAEFIEFVRGQPSCISGNWSEWDFIKGRGRCEAAHDRRAATSGTAFKPPFAVIPLTHSEHAIQHQFGVEGMLNRYLRQVWDRNSASRWFRLQVENHLNLWVQSITKTKGLKL